MRTTTKGLSIGGMVFLLSTRTAGCCSGPARTAGTAAANALFPLAFLRWCSGEILSAQRCFGGLVSEYRPLECLEL